MTSEQRRYIFVQSCIGAALVNAVLNGAIGWAMLRAQQDFPIWKVPGAAADLVATAFGVTFGTCIGASFQARWDLARGKITLPEPLPFASLIGRFPRALVKRALVLGVLSVPIFLPPVLLVLGTFGMASLARADFIALKAGFSAVQGALITPLILVAALSEQNGRVNVGATR